MTLYSRTLDGRTSQNASTTNSINVPTSAAYQLFGQVGLDISQASASFPIRVQFDGIITFRLDLVPTALFNLVEIKIVRGTNPTDPVVFSGTKTLFPNGTEGTPQEYSFAASDYNVPIGTGFVVYTVFARNITVGGDPTDVVRIGPESFNALALGN
ncbi:hypothetical protein [Paenibacillus sp. JJ1722]|uniref:hypothetical protein n=1 Tax=Paenibacillus sp. JJ1722 TaxID=3398770 RepID=UPI003AAC8554